MKFLFKKPKYQRFHIEPRYYDPVKEEMEQRIALIKQEMRENGDDYDDTFRRSRIEGAFASRRKRQASFNIMQIIIVLILVGGFGGWLYFGNIALYITLMVSFLLLYLKIKGKL